MPITSDAGQAGPTNLRRLVIWIGLCVVSLMLVLCIAVLRSDAEYVPYIPHEVTFDGALANPELVTEEHLDAVQQVLSRYGYTFIREGPRRLLIQRKLANDTDLLMNFTEKAKDLRSK